MGENNGPDPDLGGLGNPLQARIAALEAKQAARRAALEGVEEKYNEERRAVKLGERAAALQEGVDQAQAALVAAEAELADLRAAAAEPGGAAAAEVDGEAAADAAVARADAARKIPNAQSKVNAARLRLRSATAKQEGITNRAGLSGRVLAARRAVNAAKAALNAAKADGKGEGESNEAYNARIAEIQARLNAAKQIERGFNTVPAGFNFSAENKEKAKKGLNRFLATMKMRKNRNKYEANLPDKLTNLGEKLLNEKTSPKLIAYKSLLTNTLPANLSGNALFSDINSNLKDIIQKLLTQQEVIKVPAKQVTYRNAAGKLVTKNVGESFVTANPIRKYFLEASFPEIDKTIKGLNERYLGLKKAFSEKDNEIVAARNAIVKRIENSKLMPTAKETLDQARMTPEEEEKIVKLIDELAQISLKLELTRYAWHASQLHYATRKSKAVQRSLQGVELAKAAPGRLLSEANKARLAQLGLATASGPTAIKNLKANLNKLARAKRIAASSYEGTSLRQRLFSAEAREAERLRQERIKEGSARNESLNARERARRRQEELELARKARENSEALLRRAREEEADRKAAIKEEKDILKKVKKETRRGFLNRLFGRAGGGGRTRRRSSRSSRSSRRN